MAGQNGGKPLRLNTMGKIESAVLTSQINNQTLLSKTNKSQVPPSQQFGTDIEQTKSSSASTTILAMREQRQKILEGNYDQYLQKRIVGATSSSGSHPQNSAPSTSHAGSGVNVVQPRLTPNQNMRVIEQSHSQNNHSLQKSGTNHRPPRHYQMANEVRGNSQSIVSSRNIQSKKMILSQIKQNIENGGVNVSGGGGLPSIVRPQPTTQESRTLSMISPAASNSKQYSAAYNRDKLTSGDSSGPGRDEQKMRMYEARSQRPVQRRRETQISSPKDRPKLCLDHVKQNAIKFVSNEHDYRNFLSTMGVVVHSSGSTFLDHYKK